MAGDYLDAIERLRKSHPGRGGRAPSSARLIDHYVQEVAHLRQALVGPEQGWIAAVRRSVERAAATTRPRADDAGLTRADGWAAWAISTVIAPEGLARNELGLADVTIERDALVAAAIVACGRAARCFVPPIRRPGDGQGQVSPRASAIAAAALWWRAVDMIQRGQPIGHGGAKPPRGLRAKASRAVDEALAGLPNDSGAAEQATSALEAIDRALSADGSYLTDRVMRSVRDLVRHMAGDGCVAVARDALQVLLVDRAMGPAASGDGGFAAWLEFETIEGGPGAVYPNPLRMAFFRWDHAWQESVDSAWSYAQATLGTLRAGVRWSVSDSSDRLHPRVLCGGSAGGAFGLGLLRCAGWPDRVAREGV